MDKLETQVQVVVFCRDHHLPAEVVGRWVWINFPSKPDRPTRQMLKNAGFRWSPKRMQWYHTCGCRSYGRGGPDPRYRYGSIRVESIPVDDEVAA
ncbi:MAG: hypothetical protein V3T84_14640 [Phycisphaerales bacterium]